LAWLAVNHNSNTLVNRQIIIGVHVYLEINFGF